MFQGTPLQHPSLQQYKLHVVFTSFLYVTGYEDRQSAEYFLSTPVVFSDNYIITRSLSPGAENASHIPSENKTSFQEALSRSPKALPRIRIFNMRKWNGPMNQPQPSSVISCSTEHKTQCVPVMCIKPEAFGKVWCLIGYKKVRKLPHFVCLLSVCKILFWGLTGVPSHLLGWKIYSQIWFSDGPSLHSFVTNYYRFPLTCTCLSILLIMSHA